MRTATIIYGSIAGILVGQVSAADPTVTNVGASLDEGVGIVSISWQATSNPGYFAVAARDLVADRLLWTEYEVAGSSRVTVPPYVLLAGPGGVRVSVRPLTLSHGAYPSGGGATATITVRGPEVSSVGAMVGVDGLNSISWSKNPNTAASERWAIAARDITNSDTGPIVLPETVVDGTLRVYRLPSSIQADVLMRVRLSVRPVHVDWSEYANGGGRTQEISIPARIVVPPPTPPVLSISSANLTWEVGTAVSVPISSAPPADKIWIKSGGLPDGVTISAYNSLVGIPTKVGASTAAIVGSNAAGQSQELILSFGVLPKTVPSTAAGTAMAGPLTGAGSLAPSPMIYPMGDSSGKCGVGALGCTGLVLSGLALVRRRRRI